MFSMPLCVQSMKRRVTLTLEASQSSSRFYKRLVALIHGMSTSMHGVWRVNNPSRAV